MKCQHSLWISFLDVRYYRAKIGFAMARKIHKVEISGPLPDPIARARGRTITYLGETLCYTRLRPLRKAARMLLAAGLADENDMIIGPGLRDPKRVADIAKLTIEQLDGPIYGRSRP